MLFKREQKCPYINGCKTKTSNCETEETWKNCKTCQEIIGLAEKSCPLAENKVCDRLHVRFEIPGNCQGTENCSTKKIPLGKDAMIGVARSLGL